MLRIGMFVLCCLQGNLFSSLIIEEIKSVSCCVFRACIVFSALEKPNRVIKERNLMSASKRDSIVRKITAPQNNQDLLLALLGPQQRSSSAARVRSPSCSSSTSCDVRCAGCSPLLRSEHADNIGNVRYANEHVLVHGLACDSSTPFDLAFYIYGFRWQYTVLYINVWERVKFKTNHQAARSHSLVFFNSLASDTHMHGVTTKFNWGDCECFFRLIFYPTMTKDEYIA